MRIKILFFLLCFASLSLFIHYIISCSSQSIYSDDDNVGDDDDISEGDDDDSTTHDIDRDGDGWTESEGDCDDYSPTVYPGAEEICGNGIDEDCNGEDEECPIACNPYEPLDIPGQKIYEVTSSQFSGVGSLELTFTGLETDSGYKVENYYNFTTDYISGTMYVSCDSSGVSMVRWDENIFLSSIGGSLSLSGEDIPPRTYLTADPQPGDSWSYNYTLNITMSGYPFLTADVSGRFTVGNLESVTVPAGTFTALKVTNTYSMNSDMMGTITGTIEDWYVEGLGVIKTEHSSSMGELESKSLTSYAGYNP